MRAPEQYPVGSRVQFAHGRAAWGAGTVVKITARYYHVRLDRTGAVMRARSPQFVAAS